MITLKIFTKLINTNNMIYYVLYFSIIPTYEVIFRKMHKPSCICVGKIDLFCDEKFHSKKFYSCFFQDAITDF